MRAGSGPPHIDDAQFPHASSRPFSGLAVLPPTCRCAATMMNVLVLTPCLLLPTPLASPVVTTGPASASAAVLNPAGIPNSDSSSVGLLPLPIPITAPNPISSAFDDGFVLYTKYSSAANQPFRPRPMGRTLVRAFEIGHTQGFIARDPARLEIVVVFRGSAKFLLVPFESPGIVELVHIHRGFLARTRTSATFRVVGIVTKELKEYPAFRVVVTAA
ncbi:hypothetical protein DFH08DRAFT_950679 [Mycena albidolilacea]|uniref:Uncharacterized protein n=1 Tax=Mycena albidolilacea TaxID=1033008 RepID=A0AAD7ALK6_9AGAR|nr:hypothetical protein DFH08DRAFT_950679 [Mycena albidolilacea]